MKEIDTIIERIRRINKNYQHLELAVDEGFQSIKPGQTVLARQTQGWDPYLRERWWPVGITRENRLIIERPAETEYRPGQMVNLVGLAGQPYRFRRSLRSVLLLAWDTPPTPLLMMLHWLLQNQVSVTMALLGTAADYDTGHLPPELEVVHGSAETLEWPDQVMTLGWADQCFVAVSPQDELERFRAVLERFRELRSSIPKNHLFGVFQSAPVCGLGACFACMLRVDGGTALACVDGPAFDLTQVLF